MVALNENTVKTFVLLAISSLFHSFHTPATLPLVPKCDLSHRFLPFIKVYWSQLDAGYLCS